MKFVEPRPLADPDAAARKIVEIASGAEDQISKNKVRKA
jgi:hypothetical protein